MKYKITNYANFGNYYVVVFEVDGYYIYTIMYKDEENVFYPGSFSSPTKNFEAISDRFEVVPYSKEKDYGELINNLISTAEKKLVSDYAMVKEKIDFYIEKEMSQLNMF